MKKLLSLITLTTLTSTAITNINLINQSNFNSQQNQKFLMSEQNQKISKNLIETFVNEKLKDNDETKCYLTNYFSDENLIDKLVHVLSKLVHHDNDGNFIYQNDVNSVTSLDLSKSNISSFKGLDLFPNLNQLNIKENKQAINLGDLANIAAKLISLDVAENTINNTNELVYFTSLETLLMEFVKLESDWNTVFSTIANLNKTFAKINLSSNDITNSNLNSLKQLKNLTSLDLELNKISDISALSALTKLTYLNLPDNQISDLAPLAALTNLTYLNLESNQISDISNLKVLTNLIHLLLFKNHISDISALNTLTNLTFLDLKKNQVYDFSALTTLTNLTWLILEDNKISDLAPFSALTNLNWLFLKNNHIPNTDEAWAPLHQLPNYMHSWDSQEVRDSQKV